MKLKNNEEISLSAAVKLKNQLCISIVDKESNHACDQQSNNFNSKIKDIQVKKHAKLSCFECKLIYLTKTGLGTHMQSVHKNIRYDCNNCDYRANQKSNLNIHMQSVHEGIKYDCNMCKHKATTKCNLVAHKKKKHN